MIVIGNVTAKAVKHNGWLNFNPAQEKIITLFRDILEDPGFGELHVDVRKLRKDEREVFIACGKKYRFVLAPAPGKTKTD